MARVLKEEKPEILYSFLTVANLIACAAKQRFRDLRVVWGVRSSDLDLNKYDWFTRFTYLLECHASRWADLIIANSTAGREYAVAKGFPDRRSFIVIPNGIDTEHFRRDAKLREAVRAEWGIRPDEKLVGIVARLDPVKDYPAFLEAAARIRQQRGDIRFVSVGAGNKKYSAELQELARKVGLDGRVIWAGARSDLPGVYSALDLLVSSSRSESFSNVLGEAMACGVPCVATDVGDAREILDGRGLVVPAANAGELARGILEMLERAGPSGGGNGEASRKSVAELFGVKPMVESTVKALESIA